MRVDMEVDEVKEEGENRQKSTGTKYEAELSLLLPNQRLRGSRLVP